MSEDFFSFLNNNIGTYYITNIPVDAAFVVTKTDLWVGEAANKVIFLVARPLRGRG